MIDRDALLAALATFPDRLAAAARSAIDLPTATGEWTPQQVVRHLVAVEVDVHQSRLRDLEMDDDPRWDWAEPGPWPDEPELGLDGVLLRFEELRRTTLQTVAALDGTGWARTGTHAQLGVFDVEALLENARVHDEEHLLGLD